MSQLSRRDFLKLLAATAIASGIDPFQGISINQEEYYNRRLGLRLLKPQGWEFDSVADFAALRDQQVLETLYDNEVYPLKDPDNLPVFIIADPDHRQGHFAPAISLWDEVLYHPVPQDEPLAHRGMLNSFAEAYRDFVLIRHPVATTLTGASATESVWSYLHELEDGQSWSLKVRSLIVFLPPRVHTYHLVDSATHEYVREEIFDAFLRTVRYEAL